MNKPLSRFNENFRLSVLNLNGLGHELSSEAIKSGSISKESKSKGTKLINDNYSRCPFI